MTRQRRGAGSANHRAPAETAAARRTIKKYGNRRLYDAAASRYVTLADLRDLIGAQQPFVVQDARTGADLTRGVLLQILLELEEGEQPMFSAGVLAHLIRFYSHPLQALLRVYLERNIGAMVQVHAALAERAGSPVAVSGHHAGTAPARAAAVADDAERASARFQALQAEMYAHALQIAASDSSY